MTEGVKGTHAEYRHHQKGYILIYAPGHPYADGRGYVPEHRLVMEHVMGRIIDPEIEDVHHKDECVTNNNPDNLALWSKREHRRWHEGWRFINGEWWKTCSQCSRFLRVDEHFYRRHSGPQEYVASCKECSRRNARQQVRE